MAQMGGLTRETFSCSMCLDPLKEPVTIPCGHSYCMKCITTFWDGEDGMRLYSCTQCRQTFTPRPVLVKNTMLADLVEQLEKTGLQAAAAADHCYAGPEDVACDFCTGRKLKAVRSCLKCLVSYCETHVQPHYNSAAFKQHKLVEASHKLQGNVCSHHHRAKELFCRTDQQCICLCCVDEHRGHDTVSAEAERRERQRELEGSRQKIQQRIQDTEKDVKALQQEVEAIGRSADQTVEKSEKFFTELIREVKQQIRSQQETEVGQVQEAEKKLQQEMTELKRRDAEMEQLSHTEDHVQFLNIYPSLPEPSGSTDSPRTNIRPLTYFEDVTAAVSELRDQLLDVVRKMWTNVPETEPKSRTGFLKYSCDITLDPNTVNPWLLLSKGNRKLRGLTQPQSYSRHLHRFTGWQKVVSRESLTGRCYWEVKWSGTVHIAVCRPWGRNGYRDVYSSWALKCTNTSCVYQCDGFESTVSRCPSSRIGVYLDQTSGLLSFYSVSETMTLLRRVQTTFYEPLYAGLGVSSNSTAEICKLK